MPVAIRDATRAYRDDMDLLADFLDECCIVKSDAVVSNSDIYSEYGSWCRTNQERYQVGRKQFTQRLNGRGFQLRRGRLEGRTRRYWVGIALKRPGL